MEKLPTILIPPAILDAKTHQELSTVLSQTLPAIGSHHKPPKGHSESQFERDLWRYFPGKIYTGWLVKRPDYNQPYVPDFVYWDRVLNLHIDIEIDEPYTHDLRQPLHHLGCHKDEQRNQFFLNSGWIVIRFSEAQIVKSPASCCKAIASVIARITNDNTFMNAFRDVPTLKPDRRWTYSESQQMAEKLYRSQYQPAQQFNTDTIAKQKTRKPKVTKSGTIATTQFTFYCPECGEGPIRWQGHYICCPNCGYDGFTL
jgi:very-short-patch-repair endonuclease/predicted RNA-binding Zn-ribbon protein involved in translation (DUF1610 family)